MVVKLKSFLLWSMSTWRHELKVFKLGSHDGYKNQLFLKFCLGFANNSPDYT